MKSFNLSHVVGGGLLALAATFSAPVLAQHLHAGDMEIGVSNGVLQVLGDAHTHGITGYSIFEADLGDFAGGPYSTDDPGYDSEPGTFAAGSIINYTALGSLSFWNGTAWATAANNVSLRLSGNLGEETSWTSTGISGDVTGLLGQAGSNGQIHEHLEMTAVGAGRTAVGAYLIQLQLTGDGYGASNPFYVAINRGLDAASFETAVHALTSPVPEPSTWMLLLAGLGAVGVMTRQRKASAAA